ncbi:T-complex protein 11-domain-containing protein [Leucosporidium creatinivorum]|uniref:T-complex protein 11-domain-containing protein n=1 Tax=Leucosporidium creatinivorum TaxID=106004 RepID=A0A1Y2FI09_9BASI|nr:T-complex protein 11-domain-containing protein [Leucosporidium creatinivorum]
METPLPSQSTSVQQQQQDQPQVQPPPSSADVPLPSNHAPRQSSKRKAFDDDDDPRIAPTIDHHSSPALPQPTEAVEPLGAQASLLPNARARSSSSKRGPLARRVADRARRTSTSIEVEAEDRVRMSRSHSEGSLRQAGESSRLAHRSLKGHDRKRARREEAACEEVSRIVARTTGYSSGRMGASPQPLRVGVTPNSHSHTLSPLRTSFIASAPQPHSPPSSPFRHPYTAGLCPPSTSQLQSSPSSALHSAAPLDSLIGPQRVRSHHPRRRATSLPPPPRHSSPLSSPPHAHHLTSPLSHRSSAVPPHHHRRKEKLYDSRRSASSFEAQLSQQPAQEICADPRFVVERLERQGGAWPLSQGDLLAYHAARVVEEGGKRITLVPTSLIPPITRSTLRELDLSEILRNPQLRHDSVFDPNLMFRPNYDGERGDRKRELASQYWGAVSREITHGCRCSTYSAGLLLPCLCLAPGPSTSPILSSRLPSRIPPLIHELRSILLSLLPAPSSSPPSSPTSASPSASTTSANSSRDQVMETLDPVFLAQQLERGILDIGSLARFLGSTLKMHCAPMRDGLVDEMVKACEGEGVVRGLRMCFEILELMKLDIANHQLRSLRPYLVQTAMDFELRFFQDFTNRREGSQATSLGRTRKWFRASAESITASSTAEPRISSPADLVSTAVCSGVLDLIFHTDSSLPNASSSSPSSQLPETFQLDSYRLASFHADVTDLTVVYLLLSLFRQLCYPARASESEIDDMRKEIWAIMAAANSTGAAGAGAARAGDGGLAGATGSQIPGVGIAKLESSSWKEGMKDIGLQIAARATRIKAKSVKSVTSSLPIIPSAQTLTLVDSYFNSHLRADSKVFQLLQSRLKGTLTVVLNEQLADEANAQWWTAAVGQPVAMASGRRGACSVRSTALIGEAKSMASSPATAVRRGRKRSFGEGDCDVEHSDDEESEKRLRTTKASTTSRAQSATLPPAPATSPSTSNDPSLIDTTLARNGLTSLSTEVRLLGERVARVTSFHLSVYHDYYMGLLPSA